MQTHCRGISRRPTDRNKNHCQLGNVIHYARTCGGTIVAASINHKNARRNVWYDFLSNLRVCQKLPTYFYNKSISQIARARNYRQKIRQGRSTNSICKTTRLCELSSFENNGLFLYFYTISISPSLSHFRSDRWNYYLFNERIIYLAWHEIGASSKVKARWSDVLAAILPVIDDGRIKLVSPRATTNRY